MMRPTPTASATATKRRRRRSAPTSARGSDNEALRHPPDAGADREADRPTEDHRPDQGGIVGVDGIARPEDVGRADDGRRRQREGAVRVRSGAETVEDDGG